MLSEAARTAPDGELKDNLNNSIAKARERLKRQNKAYQEFCEEHDLRPLPERLKIAKASRAAAESVAKPKPEKPKEKPIPKLETYAKKIADTMDATDADLFGKQVGRSEEGIQKLYHTLADRVRAVICKKGAGCFYPATTNLEYALNDCKKATDKGRYSTLSHEMGHAFDHFMGKMDGLTFEEYETVLSRRYGYCPSQSDQFLAAMRKDRELLQGVLKDDKLLDTLNADNNSHGVQDAMDGLFGTQSKCILRCGHGEKYYNRNYNYYVKGWNENKAFEYYKQKGLSKTKTGKNGLKTQVRIFDTASETWANIASAVTEQGMSLEYVEKYLPNTLEEFRRIIGGYNG